MTVRLHGDDNGDENLGMVALLKLATEVIVKDVNYSHGGSLVRSLSTWLEDDELPRKVLRMGTSP